MSAAFETLPPDQRAVLQLILKQGRGYADLSGLLKIDEAAVRARAHAGLDALAPDGAGAALTPERRGQIADYLLGQQSAEDRASTLQHLEDSRAARRWAGALHEQLAPFARDGLPEIPAHRNGAAPATASPADVPAWTAAAPADRAPGAADASAWTAAAPAATAGPRGPSAPPPAAVAASGFDFGERPRERRGSKLGGILLLGGVAVLVAVVLIVILTGGDDGDGSGGAAPPAKTQAQTQAQRATGERAAAQEPTLLGQVNLNPPGGGRAVGVAFIMLENQRFVIVAQVRDIAPNGESDGYALWVRDRGTGRARFLGYVPSKVGADGAFAVSSNLPADTPRYNQVLVSRESVTSRTKPAAPAEIMLEGTLRVGRNTGTG